MVEHHQCYFRDSGLIFRQRKIEDWVPPDPPDPLPDDYVPPSPPPPWVPYVDRDWFDPAIHAELAIDKEFPADWEKRPHFYVPGLASIEDSVDTDGGYIHPLLKLLRAQFSNGDNWELLEDLIESNGGLRRAIERLDIGRLGRRIRRLYLSGDINLVQVQKIKMVFQHLTNDFD